jgi:hypothetical protein
MEQFFGANLLRAKSIFTLQKEILRLMVGAKPRASCKNIFMRLVILTLPCEYIFFLMIFNLKKQ